MKEVTLNIFKLYSLRMDHAKISPASKDQTSIVRPHAMYNVIRQSSPLSSTVQVILQRPEINYQKTNMRHTDHLQMSIN